MKVRELKQLLATLPSECDDYKVEFAVRVDDLSADHWAREDHPISGSFIDRPNRELVLAHSEQLSKLKKYVG